MTNNDDIYRATVRAMDHFQIDTGLALSVKQTNALHTAISAAIREASDSLRAKVAALEGERDEAQGANMLNKCALKNSLAQNVKLKELLEELAMLLEPAEAFEVMADAFYKDTGIVAPGKSLPLEWSNRWSEGERQATWNTWVVGWRASLITRIKAALST